MAKYGNFIYGRAKYGATPKLRYSVEPMVMSVITFDTINVGWESPRGTFSRIRLVRNQVGYPEHPEDGVVVWDEYATEGTVTRSGPEAFLDGQDNLGDIPFSTGSQVYYRMFIFTSDKKWVIAGSINDLVPSDHGMHDKMLSLLPQVYTTKEQTPFGTIDGPENNVLGVQTYPGSALYNFIDGLSFTYEQLLTFAEILQPSLSSDHLTPSLLGVASLNKGLSVEANLPIKNQKRLIREAVNIYKTKGTKLGIENYAECLTGYAPSATVSPNLLLSVQDSSFYKSTGNWHFGLERTFEASTEQGPTPSEVGSIDEAWNCKVELYGVEYISLGFFSPITKGVPVKETTEYTYSLYLKTPTGSFPFELCIVWYNEQGQLLETPVWYEYESSSSWDTYELTLTAPEGAAYAGLAVISGHDEPTAVVHHIDAVCFQEGSSRNYDEARAITIALAPDKTNLINNPSFEVNVSDGWSITSGGFIAQDVDVSEVVASGESSAKVFGTDDWDLTSNSAPVSPGTYFSLSSFLKPIDGPVTLSLVVLNSDNEVINAYATSVAQSSDWSRYTVTGFEALDSEVASVYAKVTGGAGNTFIDCVQLERSPVPTEYADGNLTSSFGVVWGGTENNSYSHTYFNKDTKIPRLALTINDYLPPNSFWRITTLGGEEFTNLSVL